MPGAHALHVRASGVRAPLARGPLVSGLLLFASLAMAGIFPLRAAPAPCQGPPRATPPSLKLKDTAFIPGAPVLVSFTAPPHWPSDAWVGVVPAAIPHGSEAVNDQHDLEYRYLGRRTHGQLRFTAPARVGRYDLRMHDTDAGGREITHVTFEVRQPPARAGAPARPASQAGLKLKETVYAAGQPVTVSFQAPGSWDPSAWVGVVPAAIPHGSEEVNDQHDVEYHYLNRRTEGQLTFRAPAQAGRYDLRMHDTDANGREITFVTFEVR